jgi:predicted PolB exonuclease-like 3'-5' exonuclease
MFRTVASNVWAFDLEWVPDPPSGRRAYDLPPDMPDEEVLKVMWSHGGATAEEPQPFLKYILCRVVSVAIVLRRVRADGRVHVALATLPHADEPPMPERQLLDRFLTQLGQEDPKPQLVGFSSRQADVPILIQRAIANGISAPSFCHRPNKSWEGPDYFAKGNEAHLDLKELVAAWGKGTPSLHEFATACGIPGKMGTTGDDVLALWRAGDVRAIVEYNQYDALTTYLLWLRMALFAGLFTPEAHAAEEECLRVMLLRRVEAGEAHLERYLEKWAALSGSLPQ